jgi:hypothetical protein
MTLLIAPYHLEVVEDCDQFHRKSYCDVLPSDYSPRGVTTTGKGFVMLQIKRVAELMPLALLCSIAMAQQPGSAAKSTTPAQLKVQTQAPPVEMQLAQQVSGPNASDVGPAQKTPTIRGTGTDALPTACPTPVYAVPPGDVYGRYVPYVPPPSACPTLTSPAASSSASPANSSTVQKPQSDSLIKSASLNLAQPGNLTLAPEATPSTATDSPAEGGYVRPVPTQRAATIGPDLRPFRSYAVGFRAGTLGMGVELATPLAGRINLRSGFNFFAFTDPFSIDGVNYNAKLRLQSSQTTLDWFIGGFHISPGFLYFKSRMSAPTSVGPGQTFVLGTQTFLNSVDDPVNGASSVIYPRTFSPLLLLGYGNLLPRRGGHLSLPVEVGVAYTGPPQISVALNGTACTTEGCVNFSQNADAQKFLKQEIQILNEDLKHYPVFPIVSVGLAYRF